MTRIIVVGDALLDIDILGSSTRLCPDAPVPVVDELEERPRPGGAGLAALLAASDGVDVTIVAPFADDVEGELLRALLAEKVEIAALPARGSTSVKRRVRACGQTVVRLDRGSGPTPRGDVATPLRQALNGADAILVSDYGRGTARHPQLRAVLEEAARRLPVVWDPHPRGGVPVPATRLATPNAAETGAGQAIAYTSARAAALVADWAVGAVAVTLGERGALLSYGEGAPVLIPARPITPTDVCGAGDRFASTAAARLASGAVTVEAVEAAVAAATDFVEAGGASAALATAGQGAPTPIDRNAERNKVDALLARVRSRGGTVVATGGCFDLIHAGHVATLHAARAIGDCLIVCVNSDASVRRLKGPTRPLVPLGDRVRVLEALECVDAVFVFEEDTPVEAIRQVRPDVWAKGGDYAGAMLPEQSTLREWGGQTVVLPYLDGRSTSRLLRTAADVLAGEEQQ
jgi:D-beta-D-heptose 7-phosphate kinase / D-beta-D-heptose 1-phosphate adenosyltransferase